MRNKNFIYLRKGVRRIEIVTMYFSQEPEKKSLVTLSFFFRITSLAHISPLRCCSSFKICKRVTYYVVAMDHMVLQFIVILDLVMSVSKTSETGKQSAHIWLHRICTKFHRVIRQLEPNGPNIRSTMHSTALCLQTQCVELLVPHQWKLCMHSVKVFLSM